MRYFLIMLITVAIISGCSDMNIAGIENSADQLENKSATADGVNTLFRDGWNLDAGLDGRPIGTLTITIHTSNKFLAGTDCDIYFGMRLSDGRTIQKILDKEGYNDFKF